jgi:phosphoribosylformylglycinamidine (FGAM) synthase PurS component
MKRWSEAGVFDLHSATRKTDVAEQVHDCLGRLLANVVVEAAKLTSIRKNI